MTHFGKNIYREGAKNAKDTRTKWILIKCKTNKIFFATFAPWRLQGIGFGLSV
jgi:hypothetical protein